MAVQYAKGQINLGQGRQFVSAANQSVYSGKAVKEVKVDERNAVVVEVGGTSFYTGTSKFTVESADDLKHGFLLK